MAQKVYAPLQMPKAWQVMVSLAQSRSVDEQDIDWDLVRTYTVKNNLTALVQAGAKQNLPPSLKNHPKMIEIRLLSKMQRLQTESRVMALVELAKAFADANIPMLSFKGPILAKELYGDPTMRFSCDLDILVDEATMPLACRCLEDLGYTQRHTIWQTTPKRWKLYTRLHPQMHKVFHKDGIAVELHWRICYRFDVPFDTLWQGRRQILLQGQPIATLSPMENLCYLITHGAGHGFRQLRWLLEIYTLLNKESFPLDKLYAEMQKRGVAMLLLETLLLLYRLPELSMPDTLMLCSTVTFHKEGNNTIVQCQKPDAKDMTYAEKLVEAVYPMLLRNNPEEGLDGKVYAKRLPTLVKQPPLILTVLAPSAEELEWIDLSDRFFILYYILRPIHFLYRKIQKKTDTPKTETHGSKNGERKV